MVFAVVKHKLVPPPHAAGEQLRVAQAVVQLTSASPNTLS